MYRLCVDLASRQLLPAESDPDSPPARVRRSLGLRLEWLFKNKIVDASLEDLSHCIKEDGNDGAHEGNLTKADLEDLQDFTFAFLTRFYTEPERLRQAMARRAGRRSGQE